MRRGLPALGVIVAAALAAGWQGGGAPASAPAPSGPTGAIRGRIVLPEVTGTTRRVRLRYPGQAPGAEAGRKVVPFQPVVWLDDVAGPPAATDAKATMEQQGIEFVPRVLPVRLGTTVEFPNRDDVYHNVLSYSVAQRFDLGRYVKDDSRTVKFETAGVVRLGCEIHEHMRGYIVVLASPHFGMADADGAFVLAGVPAGRHRLAVWHERFKAEPVSVDVPAGGEATITVTLAP